MEVMEALLQRQSVKSYLPTLVEPEKLEQVLEAGRLAPSAFNHQYRRFIVVDDPAVKHLLREKAGAQPMIGGSIEWSLFYDHGSNLSIG